MRIAIGNDHAGVVVKEKIQEHLEKKGHKVINKGYDGEESVDYPDFIHPVAKEVKEKKAGQPKFLNKDATFSLTYFESKISKDYDPLINILSEYDKQIGKLLKQKDLKIIIATGLHQQQHGNSLLLVLMAVGLGPF